MQYEIPYASDQNLASNQNKKGSSHSLLYPIRYLQYMLKIKRYSHEKKHSIKLCTIGSKKLLYHISLVTNQPIKF